MHLCVCAFRWEIVTSIGRAYPAVPPIALVGVTASLPRRYTAMLLPIPGRSTDVILQTLVDIKKYVGSRCVTFSFYLCTDSSNLLRYSLGC